MPVQQGWAQGNGIPWNCQAYDFSKADGGTPLMYFPGMSIYVEVERKGVNLPSVPQPINRAE